MEFMIPGIDDFWILLFSELIIFLVYDPPGGSGSIISVGYYADNSFAALGSSDPREVRLELKLCFYVFHFRFVQVHFVFC